MGRLSSKQRAALTVAALYVLSRAAMLLALVVVGAFEGRSGDGSIGALLSEWDGEWYQRIASHGYPDTIPTSADGRALQSELVFFPGLPLLIASVELLSPLDTDAASFVAVFLAGMAATLAVWRLARFHLDDEQAVRASALFAFAPGAFSLTLVYSEGLMVAAAATSLVLARQHRWILAGLVGAGATATRSTGIALVAALLLLAASDGADRRRFAAPLLATSGLVAFFVIVGRRVGDLSFWFRVQAEGWGDQFDFGRTSLQRAVGIEPPNFGHLTLGLSLLATGFAIGLLLLAVRRELPLAELSFAVVVLAMAFGSATVGLRPRMLFAAFPLLIPLTKATSARAFPFVLVASAVAMCALGAISSVPHFTVP